MRPSKRPRLGLAPASSSAKGDNLGTSTAGMPLVRMEGGEHRSTKADRACLSFLILGMQVLRGCSLGWAFGR
jgi:hypothetical protein